MKNKKTKVGVLFGGMSTEHEVSLISGLYVTLNINSQRYDVNSIYINKKGEIASYEEFVEMTQKIMKKYSKKIVSDSYKKEQDAIKKILTTYYNKEALNGTDKREVLIKSILGKSDIVFPVFHGLNGEDGTIQGLLEFLQIPYIGCGIAASSIGVDKELSKIICKSNGIPVIDYMVLYKNQLKSGVLKYEEMLKEFEYPVFIKPACSGSSIGIEKVKTQNELQEAINKAFKYDNKIIVEQEIKDIRELTISIMGEGENIIYSEIGEFNREGVDYFTLQAKYDVDSKEGIVPAKLELDVENQLKEYAKVIFSKLCISGLIRIDFFLKDKTIYFNEVNTMPGFEVNGTFLKIWDKKGYTFNEFFDQIVELGMKKHMNRYTLNYDYCI